MKTTMICPHCGVAVHLDYVYDIFLNKGADPWDETEAISINRDFCPSCNKLIITMHEGVAEYARDGDLIKPRVYTETVLYPQFSAGHRLDEAIPQKYAAIFKESEHVNSISPRASAALSRYLLQLVLHEELGISKSDLVKEITDLENYPHIPSSLVRSLQIFRRIANFGVHPKKSTNSAEIIEVGEGETEVMLQLLLELFDFIFVKPKRQEEFELKIKEKYGIDPDAK